jgi:hypothetical protein
MRAEPKDIVALGNAILKAEEDLAALRAKWDIYFPPDTPVQAATPISTATPAPAPKKGGRARQPNSLQGRIMDLFEKNSNTPFSADDVASIIHADRKKVAGILAKLAYTKKLQTHTRGLYVLKPSEAKAA